ncbi:MAG: hypothetical protein U0871_21900 [Gemmataceae bacterium]
MTTAPCPWCGADAPVTAADCPTCGREVAVGFAPRVEPDETAPPPPPPAPEPPGIELRPLGSPPSKGWFSGIAVDQPELHTTNPPHGPSVAEGGGYGRWLVWYAAAMTGLAVWGWVRAMR